MMKRRNQVWPGPLLVGLLVVGAWLEPARAQFSSDGLIISPEGPILANPATLSACTITLDGHSILAGYNSTFTIAAGVQSLTGISTPTRFAVPGSRTAQCVSRYSGTGPPRCSVLDWQCGVNDIAFDSADPLATEQASEAVWNAAINSSYYVIVNNELPCGDAGATVGGACWGSSTANLLAYNAYADFWCITHGTQARCLDDYDQFQDAGALTWQYASVDWLHLNDAGAGKLTQLIFEAIDAGPIGPEDGGGVVELGAAGLGSACACANITTNDGGSITYTRAGTAYCSTQGSWKTTGITNSSIVACGLNKPRVEPGYDGGISLLLEPAVANTTTDPLNLSSANWSTQGVGVAPPTVTANATTDPFGNVAATRLDLAATSDNTQASVIYNLTGCANGGSNPNTQGLYLKGVSGSDTINVCAYDTGSNQCFNCSYNSTTWTRCHHDNFILSTATGYFIIGNANYYSGSNTPMPAQSVYVQGATCDISENLTSFSGTGRNTETATTGATLTAALFSAAATWDTPQTLIPGQSFFQAKKDASNYNRGYTGASTFKCDFVSGGSSNVVTSATSHDMTAGASNHLWCAYGAKSRWAYTDYPNATYGLVSIASGSSTIYIGGTSTAGQEATGWIRDFKVCTSAGGCR